MNDSQSFDPYRPESIPLFEALYGKHLISLGGTAAIENMFSGITLKGHKALDIGFGLGGVPYYLAEKYQMDVCGVEINPWMVKHATAHTPPSLKKQLHFACYDNDGNIPFEKNSFDIIYSKGVFNHIENKAPLFNQIVNRLNKQSILVIADWIDTEKKNSNTSPLTSETKASYQNTLIASGFKHIEFRDDNKQFETYVLNFLSNLETQKKVITHLYDDALFETIKNDHLKLLADIQAHIKIAVRITASTR